MGGKRSPIRSHAPRWRPGRYRPRGRTKRRVRPFDPVPDTLIALAGSLVAGMVVCVIAVPLASLYRIPMYLPYGALMLLLIFMTYRVAGRDKAGRVMAVVMGVVCVLGVAALFLGRDQIVLGSRHHHDTPGPVAATRAD